MTPDRIVLDPFGPTADAASYVARPATERVLDALTAWAMGNQSVALFTGPPGIGKTLVLRVLERRLEAVCRAVALPYAALSVAELCSWALGLLGEPALTTGDAESALAASAARLAASGRPLLLVVDDASALPADTVRRLRGMAEASGGALRLLACGLELGVPELGMDTAHDVQEPDAWMREFGRETPRFRLVEPMNEEESLCYLRAHLETSVAPAEVLARFDAKTSARLHQASGGIPRELHSFAGEFLRVGERALPALPSAAAELRATALRAEPPAASAPAAGSPAGPRTGSEPLPRAAEASQQRPAPTVMRDTVAVPPVAAASTGVASSARGVAVRSSAVSSSNEGTPIPVRQTDASPPRAEASVPAATPSAPEPPIGTEPPAVRTSADAPAQTVRRARVSRPPAQRMGRAPGRAELALVAAALVGLAIGVPVVLSLLGRPVPPSPLEDLPEPSPTVGGLMPAQEESARESELTGPTDSPATTADEAPIPEMLPRAPFGEPIPPRDDAPKAIASAAEPEPAASPQDPSTAEPTPELAADASAVLGPASGALPRDLAQPSAPDTAAAAADTPPSSPPGPVPTPPPVSAPPSRAAVSSPPPPGGPSAAEGEPVRVNVNATPWAWVTVDGVDLGETPLSGVLLRPGAHELTARMPDGRVVKRKIMVDADNRFIGLD